MSYEPPVLSEFIAAGDEINLALLEVDSKEFSTDGDRKTARRAVLADAVAKHNLPDVREAVRMQATSSRRIDHRRRQMRSSPAITVRDSRSSTNRCFM
jgi:hypothetical protein